ASKVSSIVIDNDIIRQSKMSNVSIIVGLPLGVLGFLFLFWRRLKEDYPSSHIFSFAFLVLIFMTAGFILGNLLRSLIPVSAIFNASGLWFWFTFVFCLLGFGIGIYKFKLRRYETFEATALGFLFWFFAICFFTSLPTPDLKLFFFSFLTLFLIAFFFFLDTRYKTFVWYKSGKIGFSGLAIFALFFLLRGIIALLDPSMLSLIGKFDAIVSSVASFIFFIIIYNLSG
ncbi:hypothetical protein M1307_02685, partial [Patescibacteria group bacterium]|nr:hypothetical protein [Patescibacteria group bacterium]